MEGPVSFGAAFILGLFSSAHCIGMCGGIIGALSLSLPKSVREHRSRLMIYIGCYNLGRMVSYGVAGFIAGMIGTGVFNAAGLQQGHVLLQLIAAGMMIAIGLYLSGWLPQVAMIERIGVPVWKLLEPLGRKLLPVTSLTRAFAYGLIWGWLPCGLVYFVLIWSLTAGDAVTGALTMLSFALGTLPTLYTAGLLTSSLTRFARDPMVRQVIGVIIIVIAIGVFFIPIEHYHH